MYAYINKNALLKVTLFNKIYENSCYAYIDQIYLLCDKLIKNGITVSEISNIHYIIGINDPIINIEVYTHKCKISAT